MTRDEIQNEINICRNVLQQRDYTARKVAFEVAKKFKELHPDVIMPELDKYIHGEAEAETLRARIGELEAQLENTGEIDE